MLMMTRSVFGISAIVRQLHKNLSSMNKFNTMDSQKIFKQVNFSRTFSSDIKVETPSNIKMNSLESEQNTPKDQTTTDYNAITKGDQQQEHKLKVIMLEAEFLRQDGHAVPPQDFFTNEMWEHLLELSSRSARRKYLKFLFGVSKKRENQAMKKQEKQKKEEEFRSKEPEGQVPVSIEEHALTYGLKCNNIFMRVYDTTINNLYNNRLIQAMQFGQKVVIDCGYEQYMTRKENFNCAKQIMLLFADNRIHDEPYDIHYTNLTKGGDIEKQLLKYIPTMYNLEFPMNVYECSYLDLFPKNQLIYLTPHCREEMTEYDPDAVYIIGGIVDKTNQEPLSLAKAKREGVKMAKFPLDRYLLWGAGSGKSLTVNACLSILLDIKTTGDWNHALRHVPKRKLAQMDVVENYTARDFKFKARPKKFWTPKARFTST